MNITIKDRHEIYVEALKELIIDDKQNNINTGLCFYLEYATDSHFVINDFPEIMKHKPNNKGTGEYWWRKGNRLNTKGNTKRKEVLEQAIKETE